jgi:hypothetical protein
LVGLGAGFGVGRPTFDVDLPSEETGAGLAGSLVGGIFFSVLVSFTVCLAIIFLP